MNQLQIMVKELSERAQREDIEKQQTQILKFYSVLYDKAATYVNIIMAIGYAGFFGVWANMKAYMSAFDMRWSALFMLMSIIIFVMWEVIKMIVSSKSLHSLHEVINAHPAEFYKKLAAQQKEANTINNQVTKWWPLILFLTIVPALVASAILIYSFIINIFV